MRDWLGLVLAACALALAPVGLPPFAMTLLTEALILGLFAMSLDLMVGYTRLISFGHAAAYGLGAYTSGYLLLHTDIPMLFAVIAAALFSGVVAIGVAWVCTLASGVSFSMLTLAIAQLLYAVAFKWTSVTGASDGLAGIPRRPGPFGVAVFGGTAGFYYLVLACLLSGFIFCRSLVRSPFGAVLRGIRERGGRFRSATNAPLQDRRGGDRLRAGRPCRRAIRAVRRLRQYRTAVLAVLGPGADHGDRRWHRHAGRPDHRCGVLHVGVEPAEFLDRFLGVVLWPDLHLLRAVRAAGHLGPGDTRVHGTARYSETRPMALLELDGLTRRFGGIIAVDRVTMRVEAGEVRAVIGPNGAGKSTLFNLITGVVPVTDGSVRFDDERLTGLSPYFICQRGISRTFQITALFPEMTARENARLAAQARHARRWQPYGGGSVFGDAERRGDAALERLGLTHVASRQAGLLSHGDQRLLEVAMALAQQPRLLLLDEPTQGLSVEETAQAVETLAGLLSDGAMTVLLVARYGVVSAYP